MAIQSLRHWLPLPKLRWVATGQIFCSLYSSELWFKGDQVNAGFAPLEMSATEWFRRLARHYIDDMNSRVNSVNLEPGPYGRAQVVIVVEIGDILGEDQGSY